MKKYIVPVIIGATLASGVALAVPAPKVFVCKYVGTPNVNETLQTGQNPISVSQNAIANFQGVGSSFNDAQGRSFVIALDTGQPEPVCPVPQNPTPPPTPQPTPTPNPTLLTNSPTTVTTPTASPTKLPEVGASGL